MTSIFVFAALIAANIVYQIVDSRRCEAQRLMDDYYRVEFKKSYNIANEARAMNGQY